MGRLMETEPAAVTSGSTAAIVAAIIAGFSAAGKPLTPEQIQILTVIAGIVATWIIRQHVWAPANVPDSVKPRP